MSDGLLVPDWLHRRAETHRDHPALIAAGETLSFAELEARTEIAAGRLRRLGLARGDRIALLARNGIPFVEVVHGAMRIGAVVVPLGARLGAREIAEQTTDSGARALLYEAALGEAVKTVGSARVCLDREGIGGDPVFDAIEAEPLREEPRIDLDALHTIVYTSGSTGRPKGVCLTYGNHFWSAAGSAFNLGVQADDRWLACLPLSHVGGLAILLRSLVYGTTAIVHERFDPGRVNAAIDTERVSIVSVVANMLQRMLEARGRRPFPSSLRCVLLGGGPVPRALLEESRERGVPVVQTYGLTEAASQVTTLPPCDSLRKLGSAGRPLLSAEVRVTAGGAPLPPGEVGTIEVRGPTVSPGYHGAAPGASLRDGWFATGDLGRFDDEGFLYVVGRSDDRIVTGGENVHPAEVEAVLEAHPAVAEACVVGVPDPRWGNAVTACVRLRTGATVLPSELEAHARRDLAGFKVPRRILLVDDFPRTAAGKVVRRRVRDALLGDASGSGKPAPGA